MVEDDVQRLLDLLSEAVRTSGRSRASIERALGWGHGYLTHLFSGRLELKVRHMLLLTEELGFQGSDFFLWAFTGTKPGEPLPDPAGPLSRLPGRVDLRQMIREEMARQAARTSRRRRRAKPKRPAKSKPSADST